MSVLCGWQALTLEPSFRTTQKGWFAATRVTVSNKSIDTDVLAAGVACLWPAGQLQR